MLEDKRSRRQQPTHSSAVHTTLCRGDFVCVENAQQTVQTVDPFNCSIVLENGQTILFSEIEEEPKCSTPPQKRQKRISTCTADKRSRCTRTSGVDGQCHSDVNVTGGIEDVVLDIRVPEEGSGIYTSHDVSCGTVYKMADSGLLIAVGHIDLFTKVVTGWVVYDTVIDRSCVLQLPVNKLMDCAQPKLPLTDRNMLGKCQDKRFHETMINMEQNIYRKEMRVQQLTTILRRETTTALRRRHRGHTFTLGLYVPDVDSSYVGLSPRNRTIRYSYAKGNMSVLDAKLGKRWDIVIVDNITSFVSSLSIKLGKDNSVGVSIQSAQFLGNIEATLDYRSTLAAHIAELSLQPTEIEDAATEGMREVL